MDIQYTLIPLSKSEQSLGERSILIYESHLHITLTVDNQNAMAIRRVINRAIRDTVSDLHKQFIAYRGLCNFLL